MKKNRIITAVLVGLVAIFGVVSASEISQNSTLKENNTKISSQLKDTKNDLKQTKSSYADYKENNQIFLDYGTDAVSQIKDFQNKENALKAQDTVTLSDKEEIQALRKLYNSFDKKQKELVDDKTLIKFEEAIKAEETKNATAAAEAANSQATTDTIYTKDVGQIVGNSRSKIYHVPGQAGYHMSGANAVYFNSEEEAIAAGYRKALR
ncbi:DNA-entry nuclease [Lactococcus lactis subsp. lactis]|uniref:DNA-entry nuclease n=2 Tax=Lactococcus lactis TaxID=1358 RepID=A0A2A5SK80_LACLH|nr:hypothetical protein [Lactococcus lactis]KAA8704235.1 hypothetical protein F4V48_03140 [Lactococcus lactis subsp. hordniae]KSU13644.1 DNA-entry nuclease [Lactococcus lactis subsp. lactis]MCT3133825.1 hypothetical protein [Lactococcus lactis]PCS13870.1 hypothetical protein RU90_GL001349 [Lactococcus lactis subsp. hordniae]